MNQLPPSHIPRCIPPLSETYLVHQTTRHASIYADFLASSQDCAFYHSSRFSSEPSSSLNTRIKAYALITACSPPYQVVKQAIRAPAPSPSLNRLCRFDYGAFLVLRYLSSPSRYFLHLALRTAFHTLSTTSKLTLHLNRFLHTFRPTSSLERLTYTSHLRLDNATYVVVAVLRYGEEEVVQI